MIRLPLVVVAAVLVPACVSVSDEGKAPAPQGPPEIELETVRSHAEQFDDEVPVREPGSQEELAASTYLLGHLQQAGYAPLLDAVPVGDLVRSTNIVAPPLGVDAPRIVVTVPYDSADESSSNGAALGAWLEIARALNIAAPGHAVEFVALGAQSQDERGARRLAAFLDDLAAEVLIVSLVDVERVEGTAFYAGGPGAQGLVERADDGVVREPEGEFALQDAYAEVGLDEVVVGGAAEEVGRVVLEFLVAQPVGS